MSDAVVKSGIDRAKNAAKYAVPSIGIILSSWIGLERITADLSARVGLMQTTMADVGVKVDTSANTLSTLTERVEALRERLRSVESQAQVNAWNAAVRAQMIERQIERTSNAVSNP